MATLAYCVRRAITSSASRKLESDIYMDTGFTQDTSVVSTYQDLNAPPKLPERRLTTLRENQPFEDEVEQSVPKSPKGENTHDYMETIFNSKAASSTKDGSTDAPRLRVENKDTDTLPPDIASPSRATCHGETCKPVGTVQIIEQNNPHKYMVMNTVYKKLTVEKDVDVDGYLLPSKTNVNPEPPSSVEKTSTVTLSRDMTISTVTCFLGEKEEPLGNAQSSKQIDTHGYKKRTTVDENILKGVN